MVSVANFKRLDVVFDGGLSMIDVIQHEPRLISLDSALFAKIIFCSLKRQYILAEFGPIAETD